MNMSFWDRLQFLFNPGYLDDQIYEKNRRLIEDLGTERRKVETEKKYLWAKTRKMQDEIIRKDKEILRLTLGDGDERSRLMEVLESVITADGIDNTLALNTDSGREGRSESLSL